MRCGGGGRREGKVMEGSGGDGRVREGRVREVVEGSGGKRRREQQGGKRWLCVLRKTC